MKALALAAILLIPGAMVMAQDTCPATATCYEGHELEFDIREGSIQFLVVATTVKTTTDLDGQFTTETATVVEFASDGDRFVQRGDELTYPKTGSLKTADVGDTFVLTEAVQ